MRRETPEARAKHRQRSRERVYTLVIVKSAKKQCTKCKEWKLATPEYFSRNKGHKGGLNSQCKICVKLYQDTIGPKKVEAMRKRRALYPEKVKSIDQKYRDESPKYREWKNNYKETNAVNQSRYRKKHPGKVIAQYQLRRARIAGCEGSYTSQEWEYLCELFDYRCLCCGEQKPLTVDHVIPISKGGRNSIDNLQPLCLECNLRKATKVIDYRKPLNVPHASLNSADS